MAGIPDLSLVIFRLSQHEVAGEVSLKPQAWRVLTAIDGVHSVAEIARSIGMPLDAVGETIEMLFKSGFLEVAPGSPPMPRTTLSSQTLAALNKEFTRAMGPMADLILDEEIEALGEKRDHFPTDRFPELVEHLCASIRVDAKRLAFQQAMLEILRRSQ